MKFIFLVLLLAASSCANAQDTITSYVCRKIEQISFYYKNEQGENISTISNLVNMDTAKKQRVVFAMNGGMFTPEYTPVGLYIEKGKTIKVDGFVSQMYCPEKGMQQNDGKFGVILAVMD